MKNFITVGIILLFFVLIAAYFFWPGEQNDTVPAADSPSEGKSSVIVPDVNPVNKTNPFTNVKTNPFE